MKNVLLLFTFILGTFATQAQLKMPQPSPMAKIEQEVGLSNITLEFSRPSMKGRKIFGNLVPFDKIWRTGANKNTIITFSTDAKVEGKEVKAGSYALYTKPGKDSWEVYLYKDTNNWGNPKEWKESEVAAKITVKPIAFPDTMETFTMAFSDLKMDSTLLNIIWESTEVPVKIEVPTKDMAMKNIDMVMNGPSASNYYQVASFYRETGELEKAKESIEKAIAKSEKPAFWIHRQHSLILADLKDKKGAIQAAKTSMELAEQAGNSDYVKLNKDSLSEWGAK
ncbi:DUF2911 domain-containing protein [Aquimarina sp. ERC-38]|uniref:DUF2911 domain-containing protein n=1 Tax=Aquimarina sp. ERC-38 TaxID=2949996 RepID=UPI00224618B5|nr:DUF2911 domain-containing protein [Aquimarina sp. ERC-38]UZO80170.1 DUF2911 domain-containing protein [Aquimarina sp. ERC-38]